MVVEARRRVVFKRRERAKRGGKEGGREWRVGKRKRGGRKSMREGEGSSAESHRLNSMHH